MTTPYNFSAGPAMLPAAVVERIAADLPGYRSLGMSVMEMSHRGEAFMAIAADSEARLRRLLGIGDDYHVLFMQGGATLQFSCVPLNLLRGRTHAAYVDTGQWSAKAIGEARRLCDDVRVVASSAADGYHHIPAREHWAECPDAAYLHYTANETIGGVEFHQPPDSPGVPLVSDMSSTLLSRPLDVSRFGLIYAGAQKNLGIAGLTLVIVRRDLCGDARAATPRLLDYQTYAASGSMHNTPPTFAWYVAGLVFEWIEQHGALAAMAERNQAKAERLYRYIDDSGFYANPVRVDCRSWMNVPFTLPDAALDATFLAEARAAGLLELKGHRSVGGMRASLYNAMPMAGVEALISFMRDFAARRG